MSDRPDPGPLCESPAHGLCATSHNPPPSSLWLKARAPTVMRPDRTNDRTPTTQGRTTVPALW